MLDFYIESHRLVDFEYGGLRIQKNKNFSYYSWVNYYETIKRKDRVVIKAHL